MNPTPLLPIFTESMAELAWRYGDAGIPIRFHRLVLGVRWFADGSCRSRLGVDTPRGVRHALEERRVMETAPKAAKSAATAFSFHPLRTGTPAPENATDAIPGAWAGPSADPSDDLMAFEQVFYRDPAHAGHHLFTANYRRAWAAWRKAQSPADD